MLGDTDAASVANALSCDSPLAQTVVQTKNNINHSLVCLATCP